MKFDYVISFGTNSRWSENDSSCDGTKLCLLDLVLNLGDIDGAITF